MVWLSHYLPGQKKTMFFPRLGGEWGARLEGTPCDDATTQTQKRGGDFQGWVPATKVEGDVSVLR